MNLDLKIDFSRARASAVTAQHGLSPAELSAMEARISDGHRALVEDRRRGRQGFYDLYKDREMLSAVTKTAKKFAKTEFDNLVVLGIGGSALGISALFTSLKSPYHNLLTREERQGCPRVFVMDNIDPDTFAAMLEICPPEKTLFNVISKSGGTAETIAQLLIVLESLERAVGHDAVKRHVVITTGPPPRKGPRSPIQQIKQAFRLQGFEVPRNVGGRFSIFTPVGMFPAALMGIDLTELTAGCRAMDRRTSKRAMKDNPAYVRAGIHCIMSEKKNKTLAVMMPYTDRLRDISDWYRQLWAESLGKRLGLDGQAVPPFAAQTPIKALGVTDQHSQLQQFLEGPNDKVVTILETPTFERNLKIPDVLPSLTGIDYMRGKTMNRLIASERKATADALREADRPVLGIVLPRINAHTIAQLLYMLEVETAMAGQLFGVNAFDQPAVEAIKIFTREYMEGKK